MALNNPFNPLFSGGFQDDLCPCEGVPIDNSSLLDAYENDDFWFPPLLGPVDHDQHESKPERPCAFFPIDDPPPVDSEATSHNGVYDSSSLGSSDWQDWHAPVYSSTSDDLRSVTNVSEWQVGPDPMNARVDMYGQPFTHPHAMQGSAQQPLMWDGADFCQDTLVSPVAATGSFMEPMRAPHVGTMRYRPVKAARACVSKKSKNRRNVKGSPITPLTAYNFYFRVKRQQLLDGAANSNGIQVSELPSDQHPLAWILQSSRTFQDTILADQWGRDPTAKRKHSKTHGRFSFGSLTAQIAASWKTLPTDIRNVFGEIAARDYERYDIERRKFIPCAV